MIRLPIPKNLVINFAGMAFLGITGFISWQANGLADLLSVRGIGFLALGVLIAGSLVGWPLNWLHRHFCMNLVHRQHGNLTPAAMQTMRYTGTAVMMVQIIVVYVMTEKAWAWLFAGGPTS